MEKKAEKRLMNEFKRIQNDLPEGCCASPSDNDLFKWTGYIFGPEDTEWEEG